MFLTPHPKGRWACRAGGVTFIGNSFSHAWQLGYAHLQRMAGQARPTTSTKRSAP